jgi:1-acyl-sn-glycerol-3-phosphate acyltransferase
MNTSEIILVVSCGALASGAAAFAALAYFGRGPDDTFFLACLRAVATVYARVLHRARFVGTSSDPLPESGAGILVANHLSGVDPVILSIVTKRRVKFLMAREYYETPVLHGMVRRIGCIPVNRDGRDLGATKAAIRALRQGEIVGIFPQGGIREAESSLEGKSGVALLALRTGAPVYPFRVEGSPNVHSVLRAALSPSRITVRSGPPLRFSAPEGGKPTRRELEEVTARILDAVAAIGKDVTGSGNGSTAPGREPAPERAREAL